MPSATSSARRVGRPEKLTRDRQQRICDALRLGVAIEQAAVVGGISYSAFHHWRQLGEQGHGEQYVAFAQAVREAMVEAEMSALSTIRDASHTSWQAAGWFLERRWPARWSQASRVQLDYRLLLQSAEQVGALYGIAPVELLAESGLALPAPPEEED